MHKPDVKKTAFKMPVTLTLELGHRVHFCLHYCTGGWYRNDRIEDNTCYGWPSAGGTLRGIQMTYGSCLAVFRNTGYSNANGYVTSKCQRMLSSPHLQFQNMHNDHQRCTMFTWATS